MPLLYLARILGGSASGVGYALLPIYNEEITEVKIRGVIGIYVEIMNCVGVVLAFTVGSYLPFIYFNVFNLIPPVAFLLTFVWMPESPMWLLMKGRDEEAEKSLRWLRGAAPGEDEGISVELDAMRDFLKSEAELSSLKSSKDPTTLDAVGDSWFTPAVKATFIVFWLMVFQQMCGNNTVMFNAVSVYQDASSSLDSNVASIITGVLQALAAVASCAVVDMTGRRPLLIFSMVIASAFLALMALYFNFKEQLKGVGWVPIAVLSAFIFNVEVGFGPLPWLMMAELSPAHAKKTIGAIGCGINWSLVFIVTKTYSNMVSSLGLPWTYAVYSIFCAVGIFFVLFVVPETKHKTREQIQNELRFGRKRGAKR